MINEEIPNLLNSLGEKSWTFVKISFRISRVIDVEIFAQQYPSKIVPRTPAIDIAMATPHII